MRVAYIARGVFISGAERSLQTTLRALPAAGVEPFVIGAPDDKLIPWCRAKGVPFHACPLAVRDRWHPLRWWRSVRQMRGLLRTLRIDLVHSNQIWCYPAAGTAARDLGLPRVCHLRDEISPEGLQWWCAAGVEALLCISLHIETQVSGTWPAGRSAPEVHTLLNPVPMPALPTPGDREHIRRRARQLLGIDETSMVFGFIGQIIPVKGLPELLTALAKLGNVKPWQLIVAGKDPNPGAPHETLCRRRVRELGLERHVKFLGYLEDVSPFYQAIDVAVVPSLEEPLGRVPLEAAASARPAIAFATGGLPETIRHGETGWLIARGDVEGLREALADFLEARDPEMGLAARAWVESISDPGRYAGKLAALYHRLLGGRARPHSSVGGTVGSGCQPLVNN
jgi:glycosyltransferase involved in cell wall biosynthesis